jgi:hypothetical protein
MSEFTRSRGTKVRVEASGNPLGRSFEERR